MASGGLGVHWCLNIGKANAKDENSGLGWTESFSKGKQKAVISDKLLFRDSKLWQKKSEAKCSLRLVNNNHLEEAYHGFNTTNSNSLDPFTDLFDFSWSQIGNRHQNTRILEEDQISEKLDHWIRDCLSEIVSNIGRAPLLVHVYSDDEKVPSSSPSSSSTSSIKIMIEKGVARGLWEPESPTPTPNGIILVKELNSSDEGGDIGDENMSSGVGVSDSQCNKLWGVLIQGKWANRVGHASYILKTCRVQSLFGFCTHFCLTRVECFVETAETQLQKMWLQR